MHYRIKQNVQIMYAFPVYRSFMHVKILKIDEIAENGEKREYCQDE